MEGFDRAAIVDGDEEEALGEEDISNDPPLAGVIVYA
jgi:hypothetical protein